MDVLLALAATLAQTTDPTPAARATGGQVAFVVAVLVFCWVALVVVVWVFWRAKRREDARKRKEHSWPNAPSS